jgi:16S rRNA G966 N2-methylase RsmD
VSHCKLKLLGLLQTRAHWGGLLYLLRQVNNRIPFLKFLQLKLDHKMDDYSNRRSKAFDTRYNTDTFIRSNLKNYEIGANLDWDWLYGPINPDFFHEIIRRLNISYQQYTFLDVGAGKGMCMMLAGDYAFRRSIALEFSQELVEAGKKNVHNYEKVTGKHLEIEWICEDFMQYAIPNEPIVIFLNNPFPEDISLLAVKHIQAWLSAEPRNAIVVYRKAPKSVTHLLNATPQLKLLTWSPYWQAFTTGSQK